MIVTTACGHVYHKECIDSWLDTSETCPNCRHNLDTNRMLPGGGYEFGPVHMTQGPVRYSQLFDAIVEGEGEDGSVLEGVRWLEYAHYEQEYITLTLSVNNVPDIPDEDFVELRIFVLPERIRQADDPNITGDEVFDIVVKYTPYGISAGDEYTINTPNEWTKLFLESLKLFVDEWTAPDDGDMPYDIYCDSFDVSNLRLECMPWFQETIQTCKLDWRNFCDQQIE